MKEYFCSEGHDFNQVDVKEYFYGLSVCPFCWPRGFNVKHPENVNGGHIDQYKLEHIKSLNEEWRICT